MEDYYSKDWYTIIKKHSIIAFIYIARFIFLYSIALIMFYISINFRDALWEDITKYVFFPLVFILINYSFFRLILWLIKYFNYLFIIKWDQIFIINCSLILKNDIEVIDSFKIIKIDAFCRGFISNVLWFWNIVIEFQTKEERIFRFMPKPYILLKKLNSQRKEVLESRKKKYIIDDVAIEENEKQEDEIEN